MHNRNVCNEKHDDTNTDNGNCGGSDDDNNEMIRIKKRWHKISVIINNCRDRYTYISRIQVHKVHTHYTTCVQSFATALVVVVAIKLNQNTPHPNTINH